MKPTININFICKFTTYCVYNYNYKINDKCIENK